MFVTTSGFFSPTHAQRIGRYSFDVTVGLGGMETSGKYSGDGGGFAGDVMLARRFRSDRGPGLIAGVSASYHFVLGEDCTIYLPFEPSSDCAPQIPDMRVIGALTGWESRNGAFRVMAGVGYAHPTSGGGAVALQARLDGAIGLVRHVALTASVRPVIIPSYRGDTFRSIGIGIGFRVR
jgi:hypothetical protein